MFGILFNDGVSSPKYVIPVSDPSVGSWFVALSPEYPWKTRAEADAFCDRMTSSMILRDADMYQVVERPAP